MYQSFAVQTRLYVVLFAAAIVTSSVLSGCDVPTPPTDSMDDSAMGNDDGAVNDDDTVQPDDTVLPGLRLTSFETDDFAGSGNCAVCHSELMDDDGNDVSIDRDWRATLMANAAKDPLFAASVESEVESAPASLRATIEGTCATCHTPMARTQAVADATAVALLDEGLFNPENELHEAAADGVSCSLCHQIQDDFVDDPSAGFSGGYVIDTSTERPDRVLFGPFPDPQQPAVMQTAVGYVPTFSDHIESAALCSTCHTLFTPTLNAAGEIVGEFPEQTPYIEWQHSGYGDGFNDDDRTCQDCHMPTAATAVAISRVPSGLDKRAPFYRHQFLGGNVFMLRLLRDNIDTLGLTASTDDFNAAITATERFLQNETADLDITETSLDGDTLNVSLRIANRAGHKFPTSFPIRRAWLHFSVRNAAGTMVFESGAPQSDGRVAGNDADEDAESVEPHYDVVNTFDQVQIYEAVMADTDGRVTYTLLRGDTYIKDNRLLPAGFVKGGADPDVGVYGAAATDDDFDEGLDSIDYSIEVNPEDGPFAVTVELLFSSVSFQYVQTIATEGLPLGNAFTAYYEAADKTPTIIAAATAEVQ